MALPKKKKPAAKRSRKKTAARRARPTYEETSGYSVVYRPIYREPENLFTRFGELAQKWLKESGLMPYAALGALVIFCILALWTNYQPLARDPASRAPESASSTQKHK